MRAYSIYGVVGREATVRAAAGPAASALVEKLRFGLAFVPLTDELSARLAGPGVEPGAPPFIELMRLTPAAIDWLGRASARGPLAYIEAEFADGAGFHAAAAWRDGRLAWGPRHVEEREPVNAVLRQLGVVADAGKDELDSVGLLELGARPPG